MEKACEVITMHDGALPNSPFDKHNRHMRETIIDQARRISTTVRLLSAALFVAQCEEVQRETQEFVSAWKE